MELETLLFEKGDDHVATITINRPEQLNCFNRQMMRDFVAVWEDCRSDLSVRAVVLRAAGQRAFCTGVDRKDPEREEPDPDVWNREDPGVCLSPKQQRLWKPVIVAVNGMCAGGAFYMLNEADIIIASEDATFFDPHVTYGMTAALEPIGMAWRIPRGEALRIALMGLHERMSAARAFQIGMVSEVTTRDDLWSRAAEIAATIATAPPAAVEGTVRAVWESFDMTRSGAQNMAMAYTLIGNPIGREQMGSDLFSEGYRPKFTIR